MTQPSSGCATSLAADLVLALKEVLALPDSAGAEAIRAGSAKCDAAFAALRDQLDPVRSEPSEELAELLKEAMRLNAIASSLAQRRIEKASTSIHGVRQAREATSATQSVRTGASCDVRG